MQPDLIAGRYRVERPVGRGGMGTVWLCRDEVLKRDVAVKQVGRLPGETVTDTARAMREARSSAALSHRNVVSVFDVVEQDGAAWMVMEYVPSRTLTQILREDGPLDPLWVAGIGAQVADGLAAAHRAGTVHRDVKPANILVTDDGVAKISDFGIARTAGDATLTQTGLLTGTPGYFSPELARGGDPAPASDVWSLGATLYVAVEGQLPYAEHANPLALLQTIATDRPRRPHRAGALGPALERMMDPDPRSRWAMADAAHALHRLVHRARPQRAEAPATLAAASSPDIAAGTAAGTTAAAPKAAADGDRGAHGRLLWLVGIAVLTAVVVFGLLLLTHPGSGPDTRAQAGPSGSGSTSSGSPSPSGSPTAEPSKPSEPAKPPRPRLSTRQREVRFLSRYYQLVPEHTNAGWAELAPSEQSVGRASYERWWGSIDEVDASAISPRGPSAADITLTYHFSDGRVVRERQHLDLDRTHAGRYLIARDTTLSSRTLSS
jgi:serine/threonine protein kinase